MSEGRKSEVWFAMYAEKFLWGTIKAELEVDERAVWVDFLCLAATFEGKVDITYTKKLAGMLVVPHELLERSIKKFEKTKRIRIENDKEESKIYAIIQKWNLYQFEFLGGKRKARRRSASQNEKKKDLTMRNNGLEEKTLEDIRIRGDDSRREEKKREESEKREEEKRNNKKEKENPHPPTSKKVEALIKEKSKSFTERKTPKSKTPKLNTSEGAFSQQMDELLAKKKRR